MLQWGRVQMSAEVVLASVYHRIKRVASMGPRSDERGSSVGYRSLASAGLLQWGRVQMSAEVGHREYAMEPTTALQWGRVQMSAEVGHREYAMEPTSALQWGRVQMSAEVVAWKID